MSVIPSQFLKLPDDILLEVLAQLPAFLVVLRFRPVCRKIDQLSRERHLWIGFFYRTKDMLHRPIDLEQVGTSGFEISICRAEMLEEKWGNEDALWVVPRFWRGAPLPERHMRRVVAIMGDYIIVERGELHNWVSIHNLNGPPICSFAYPPAEGWGRSYMDLGTSTFYLVSQTEYSLKVMGIQVGFHGPQVAIEYSLPLRDRYMSWAMNNGFIVVRYLPSITGCEVDIINLGGGTLSWFSLPPYPPTLQQTGAHPIRRTFAIETHIIEIYAEQKFAIFKRPTSSQGTEQPNADTRSLSLGITPLEPLLEGGFPWPIASGPYIIPRSTTSFAMVVIPQSLPRIHVFFFTSSGLKSSVEGICSMDIPMGFHDFVLPIPPSTAKYALGVLGIQQFPPDVDKIQGECKHFAVRIGFSDPPRDTPLANQGSLTLQRMHLIPAVNEPEEQARVCHFDCFSGRVYFLVNSNSSDCDLVLDYLSLC